MDYTAEAVRLVATGLIGLVMGFVVGSIWKFFIGMKQ